MKRTRFTDEQIIGILAEHEAGAKCVDLCRKHGMSEGTFYNWKSRFGGMTVSEAKRLKALEDENAKLKKLLAEQMLDLTAMKELISKSGDACREARSCRASEGPVWDFGTAGVSGRRGRPQDGPLSLASRAPDAHCVVGYVSWPMNDRHWSAIGPRDNDDGRLPAALRVAHAARASFPGSTGSIGSTARKG